MILPLGAATHIPVGAVSYQLLVNGSAWPVGATINMYLLMSTDGGATYTQVGAAYGCTPDVSQGTTTPNQTGMGLSFDPPNQNPNLYLKAQYQQVTGNPISAPLPVITVA